MAETKSPDQLTFHTKRKPDVSREDSLGHRDKAQKLETVAPSNGAKHREGSVILTADVDVLSVDCSAVTDEKIEKVESDVIAEDGGDEGGNFDHSGAGDADEDVGDEEPNEEVVLDRKGKGIMTADKGKGKLIEEDDEDEEDSSSDEDDSSDDGLVSDGDSDLSDDPLTEVDMTNILPSRTRGRTIDPRKFIASDMGNDDDSDDDTFLEGQ